VAKGKVLVVDDDPAVLTFMVRALMSEGYDVIVAPNGQHALDQLARVCPQVIVLDVMMPIMDGLEFLDARSLVTHCSPPVIAFSAVGENKQALRAKGIADFLPKPFNLDDLLNLIAKYAANVPE
jgi:two-component system, OmpR family, response regulator MprA